MSNNWPLSTQNILYGTNERSWWAWGFNYLASAVLNSSCHFCGSLPGPSPCKVRNQSRETVMFQAEQNMLKIKVGGRGGGGVRELFQMVSKSLHESSNSKHTWKRWDTLHWKISPFQRCFKWIHFVNHSNGCIYPLPAFQGIGIIIPVTWNSNFKWLHFCFAMNLRGWLFTFNRYRI